MDGGCRGWIILTQIGIIFGVVLMSLGSPKEDLLFFGIVALLVAFLSASQDIVTDAYRTDILREKERGLGVLSVIFGGMAGGTLMVRLGLFRSLLIFGILQALSNFSFMALALIGKSYGMLIFAVAFENFSGGMGTASFIALLMTLCNQRYSATQYALLSSLSALGRIFLAPPSGYLVESVGWAAFFIITAVSAVPGLWLLWSYRDTISDMRQTIVSNEQ